jgi:hypothetical protein
MSTEQGKDMVLFLDTVGRTIIAHRDHETDTELVVKNPAIVNVAPQQGTDPATGQPIHRMALQLFPVVFREFLADKEEPLVFAYNKKNITMPVNDVAFDFKIIIQYEQLFSNVPQVAPQQASQPAQDNTIKLFD